MRHAKPPWPRSHTSSYKHACLRQPIGTQRSRANRASFGICQEVSAQCATLGWVLLVALRSGRTERTRDGVAELIWPKRHGRSGSGRSGAPCCRELECGTTFWEANGHRQRTFPSVAQLLCIFRKRGACLPYCLQSFVACLSHQTAVRFSDAPEWARRRPRWSLHIAQRPSPSKRRKKEHAPAAC